SLPLEIETWNPEANSALWARAYLPPGVSDFWLYWGNARAPAVNDNKLWTPSYKLVMHLSDRFVDNDHTIRDSTGDHDGEASMSMDDDSPVPGVIGGSLRFQDLGPEELTSGDFIVVESSPLETNNWSSLTLEAWVRHGAAGEHRIICKSPSIIPSEHVFALGFHGQNNDQVDTQVYLRLGTDDNDAIELHTQSNAVKYGETAQWHHLAMTWNGNWIRLYLDGVNVQIAHIGSTDYAQSIFYSGATLKDDTIPLTIANVNNLLETKDDARFFIGKLDEVRLSNRAHSAAWILFQFQSMQDQVVDYSAPDETL
ncbi:MAG TPA: LamG domain-containing protein, partial [Nannocystis exedens]|nr:LamG domain-containing protein [Nannocystis exedens]